MMDPQLPDFIQTEEAIDPPATFRPESGRRGELVAWGSALTLAILMTLQSLLAGEVTGMVMIFFVVVFISALLISYTNWVERNTLIHITLNSVEYASPLRKLEMTWDQINEIWLAPSRFAWRISIAGEKGHFNFHTLVSLESLGGSARMGFPQGEQLIAHLVRQAHLPEPSLKDGIWVWKRAPD